MHGPGEEHQHRTFSYDKPDTIVKSVSRDAQSERQTYYSLYVDIFALHPIGVVRPHTTGKE